MSSSIWSTRIYSFPFMMSINYHKFHLFQWNIWLNVCRVRVCELRVMRKIAKMLNSPVALWLVKYIPLITSVCEWRISELFNGSTYYRPEHTTRAQHIKWRWIITGKSMRQHEMRVQGMVFYSRARYLTHSHKKGAPANVKNVWKCCNDGTKGNCFFFAKVALCTQCIVKNSCTNLCSSISTYVCVCVLVCA